MSIRDSRQLGLTAPVRTLDRGLQTVDRGRPGDKNGKAETSKVLGPEDLSLSVESLWACDKPPNRVKDEYRKDLLYRIAYLQPELHAFDSLDYLPRSLLPRFYLSCYYGFFVRRATIQGSHIRSYHIFPDYWKATEVLHRRTTGTSRRTIRIATETCCLSSLK